MEELDKNNFQIQTIKKKSEWIDWLDIHFGRMTFGYDENDDRILMSDEIDIKMTLSSKVRKPELLFLL